MPHHVVLGAGGIGRATARALTTTPDNPESLKSSESTVTLVSRSGRDPRIPGVTARAADVTDAATLGDLCTGAATVVNALNPSSYTSWARDWPPMASTVLDTCRRTGTRLVTVSNLYVYGEVDAPMTERTPLAPRGPKGEVRAQMWRDALEAHRAGDVRVAEVRASDYVGAETLASSLADAMVIKPASQGTTPRPPMGRPDAPHTFTADVDVAALVAALTTADDDAWGRVWHVPSDQPVTLQELADLAADVSDQRHRRVRPLPRLVVTALGPVVPLLGELREVRHQFERAYVLDSSAAQQTFGLSPTPIADSVRATVAALQPSR